MVRRKDLKKAVYLLKKYNQTPIEVIQYIEDKLFSCNVNKKTNGTQINDDKKVNVEQDKYQKLINGISLRYDNRVLSKSEFNKLKSNFKTITGETLKMSYENFIVAEKYVIDGLYLNSVKEIKTVTSYDLAVSKRISDAIRMLHRK